MDMKRAHSVLVWTILGSLLLAGLIQIVTAKPRATQSKAAATTTKPRTAAKAPKGKEVATLAAGCFWSMEAMFQRIKGVEKVEPGYAGGHVANASYEQVCSGETGHAEAVQITFDPKVVPYSALLQVLLTMRDPTTLNQQGPDVGTQYRSAIFAHSPAQAEAAREAIGKITEAKVWKDPIVTPVEEVSNFYRAEEYHVDYYNRHSDNAYSRAVIAPKLAELQNKFAPLVKP
jgi:peptide-methionine (S)-S-oxide reductase